MPWYFYLNFESCWDIWRQSISPMKPLKCNWNHMNLRLTVLRAPLLPTAQRGHASEAIRSVVRPDSCLLSASQNVRYRFARGSLRLLTPILQPRYLLFSGSNYKICRRISTQTMTRPWPKGWFKWATFLVHLFFSFRASEIFLCCNVNLGFWFYLNGSFRAAIGGGGGLFGSGAIWITFW